MKKRKPERIFLDNNFLIDVMDASQVRHNEAKRYLDYYLREGFPIFVSTVVLAEYGVVGNLRSIPLSKMRITPFNMMHAAQCSVFAKYIFSERKQKHIDVARQVIHNDVKILAQAAAEKATILLSADGDMTKIFQKLSQNFPFENFRHVNHGNTPLAAHIGNFLV